MKRQLITSFGITIVLVSGCSGDDSPAPGGSVAASGEGGRGTQDSSSLTTGSGGTNNAADVANTAAGTASTGNGFGTMGGLAGTSSSVTGAGGAVSTGTVAMASVSTSSGGAVQGQSSSTGSSTGAGGGMPSIGSDGCGMEASQPTGSWVRQPDVNIQGTDREWSIYLPNNYDSNRPYPLVVQLHGCGSGTNNVPVERASGDNAIHVRGTAAQSDACWNTSTNGPNLEFFDAMVDGVSALACVDQNRIFASGYSSGSWLVSVLACLRGDRLRAAGTVAGGEALFGKPTCSGTIAQIFIHDQDDTENPWSGHEPEMNRLIAANGCTPENPVAEDPEPCVRYQGCGDNPIKFCPTMGQGHNRQDNYAPAAFWGFFSEF